MRIWLFYLFIYSLKKNKEDFGIALLYEMHAVAIRTRIVRWKNQTDGGRSKRPQIACTIVATEMWQRTTPAALSGCRVLRLFAGVRCHRCAPGVMKAGTGSRSCGRIGGNDSRKKQLRESNWTVDVDQRDKITIPTRWHLGDEPIGWAN